MATIAILQGKVIILGVCGSIASYKAVDLASKLTQAGAAVDVIMTEAAQRFVSPLAFQAVSGRPVYTDLWQSGPPGGESGLPTHIAHVGLAERSDLLLIAPATANTLAKLAHGLADDLLSITALAAQCPVAVAPAMDGAMYENPAVRANLDVLRARGIHVIEPASGRFASGLSGRGRLPETPMLLGHVRRILGEQGALAGRKLVVTAGGTREALDPVRFLSNRSSGKQGYAIAQAALDAGAQVVLISAAQHLPLPIGARLIAVDSAAAMRAALLENLHNATALVMAAAVADYKPANVSRQKLKKKAGDLSLPLARTDDILLSVKQWRAKTGSPKFVLGFAAESENLRENAADKLQKKGLDLIFANDISAADAGFQADSNRVLALDKRGGSHKIELSSKADIGVYIIKRIIQLLA